MQSTSTATSQPLGYGQSKRDVAWTDRIDTVALAFAATQVLIGLLLMLAWLTNPAEGYFELRATRWFQRAGWWMSGGRWTVIVMTVASALALLGATRPAGRRRRRWYAGYVIIWALVLATLLLGTAIVDRELEMRQRWVSTYTPKPKPHNWKSISVGAENYVAAIGIMLAFNPVLALLTFRAVGARREPPDAAIGAWYEL